MSTEDKVEFILGGATVQLCSDGSFSNGARSISEFVKIVRKCEPWFFDIDDIGIRYKDNTFGYRHIREELKDGRGDLKNIFDLVVNNIERFKHFKHFKFVTFGDFEKELYGLVKSFKVENSHVPGIESFQPAVFGSSVYGGEFNPFTVKDIEIVTVYNTPFSEAFEYGVAGLGDLSIADGENALKDEKFNIFGPKCCFVELFKVPVDTHFLEHTKWEKLLEMQIQLFPKLKKVRLVGSKVDFGTLFDKSPSFQSDFLLNGKLYVTLVYDIQKFTPNKQNYEIDKEKYCNFAFGKKTYIGQYFPIKLEQSPILKKLRKKFRHQLVPQKTLETNFETFTEFETHQTLPATIFINNKFIKHHPKQARINLERLSRCIRKVLNTSKQFDPQTCCSFKKVDGYENIENPGNVVFYITSAYDPITIANLNKKLTGSKCFLLKCSTNEDEVIGEVPYNILRMALDSLCILKDEAYYLHSIELANSLPTCIIGNITFGSHPLSKTEIDLIKTVIIYERPSLASLNTGIPGIDDPKNPLLPDSCSICLIKTNTRGSPTEKEEDRTEWIDICIEQLLSFKNLKRVIIQFKDNKFLCELEEKGFKDKIRNEIDYCEDIENVENVLHIVKQSQLKQSRLKESSLKESGFNNSLQVTNFFEQFQTIISQSQKSLNSIQMSLNSIHILPISKTFTKKLNDWYFSQDPQDSKPENIVCTYFYTPKTLSELDCPLYFESSNKNLLTEYVFYTEYEYGFQRAFVDISKILNGMDVKKNDQEIESSSSTPLSPGSSNNPNPNENDPIEHDSSENGPKEHDNQKTSANNSEQTSVPQEKTENQAPNQNNSMHHAELHTHLLGMGSADFWINFVMREILYKKQADKGEKPKDSGGESSKEILKFINEEKPRHTEVCKREEFKDVYGEVVDTTEVVFKVESLKTAFQLENMTEYEVLEFLRNIFGCKAKYYRVDNHRTQMVEVRRGYTLNQVLDAYDDDKNNAKYFLRKSFEMEHVAENRGKFTPNFYPQKYSLKDDMYFQNLKVLTVLLIHTIVQYAWNDVNYVEYSVSFKDLNKKEIYKHLTPKCVVEVLGEDKMKENYLEFLRDKKKNKKNVLDIKNCNMDIKSTSLDVSIEQNEKPTIVVNFNYYFLCAFNRNSVKAYPTTVKSDQEKMDHLASPTFDINIMKDEAIYQEFLKEKESLIRMFTVHEMESHLPKPPLNGAVLGLDWVGDEKLYPFCAFVTPFVKQLAKAYFMMTGSKLGLRYHCGENVFIDYSARLFAAHMDITYESILLMQNEFVKLRLGHGVGFLLHHSDQDDKVIVELAKRMNGYVDQFIENVYFEWCPSSNEYLLHNFHNITIPTQNDKLVVATDNDGIMPIRGMKNEINLAIIKTGLSEQIFKTNSNKAKFVEYQSNFANHSIEIVGFEREPLVQAKRSLVEKFGSTCLVDQILINDTVYTLKTKKQTKLSGSNIIAIGLEELDMLDEKIVPENVCNIAIGSEELEMLDEKIVPENIRDIDDTELRENIAIIGKNITNLNLKARIVFMEGKWLLVSKENDPGVVGQ